MNVQNFDKNISYMYLQVKLLDLLVRYSCAINESFQDLQYIYYLLVHRVTFTSFLSRKVNKISIVCCTFDNKLLSDIIFDQTFKFLVFKFLVFSLCRKRIRKLSKRSVGYKNLDSSLPAKVHFEF